MSFRHVLLAAVIVGVLGGLLVLPWFLFVRLQSASGGSSQNDASPGASGSLRYDGKTFEQWQSGWQKELKPDRRIEACRAMAAFGTHGLGKEAAGLVVDMVRERCRELGPDVPLDENDPFFSEARTALIRIGPPSSLVLLDCLKDQAGNVNRFGRSIKDVDLHPAAVAALVKMIQGDNQESSALALQTLGQRLQKTPRSSDFETALHDAVKKGKHARSFLDSLQHLMAGDKTRQHAVAILGALGSTAQPAAGTLLKAVQAELRRDDRRGNSAVTDDRDLCLMIDALGKVQGDPVRVVPVLCEIVSNKSEKAGVRNGAVKALGQMGPQAMLATETLVDALDDTIRCEALEALGKLEASMWVVPRLEKALAREIDDPSTAIDVNFVKNSLDYLGKVGPQAASAVNVLVRIYAQVAKVRPQVVAVLEKIGPAARPDALRLGNDLRGTEAKSLTGPGPMPDEIKTTAFTPGESTWKSVDNAGGKSSFPTQGAVVNPSVPRAGARPTVRQFEPYGPTPTDNGMPVLPVEPMEQQPPPMPAPIPPPLTLPRIPEPPATQRPEPPRVFSDTPGLVPPPIRAPQ